MNERIDDKCETTGSVPDEFRIAMRYAFSMGYSQGHCDTLDGTYKYRSDEQFDMANKLIDESFAEHGATNKLLPL